MELYQFDSLLSVQLTFLPRIRANAKLEEKKNKLLWPKQKEKLFKQIPANWSPEEIARRLGLSIEEEDGEEAYEEDEGGEEYSEE